jgi:two-component system, chemotaxis family, response regulator WspR
LLNLLRKSGSEIPVIILTGNNEISIAIDAMKCGANDYILKDENIQDTFLIAVEKVMEKHRLEMQNKQLLAELELKNEELRRIALIDGLTGIANRRYFDDFSNREWRRAIRESTPFAIIMIDIDFFKLYNDSYGHQKGDDCLRSVAQALAGALRRPSDLIARYGGEEFVAILPNTKEDGARIVAEYMEKNITKLKIRHNKSQVSDTITVSMGIGSVTPKRGSDVLELLSLVDKALYEAKRQGRKCIKSIDRQSAEGKLIGTKN